MNLFCLLLTFFFSTNKILSNEYELEKSSLNGIRDQLNSMLEKENELKLLDQDYANQFKQWLDSKSIQLYEMSKNYSAYHLLNHTFNTKLREEVKTAETNFTSMIINISQDLSNVLQKKSLIAENLSDFVEKTFESYRKNKTKVNESTEAIYYDSKSPKTFCDVYEIFKKPIDQISPLNSPKRLKRSASSDCFTSSSNYCRGKVKDKDKEKKRRGLAFSRNSNKQRSTASTSTNIYTSSITTTITDTASTPIVNTTTTATITSTNIITTLTAIRTTSTATPTLSNNTKIISLNITDIESANQEENDIDRFNNNNNEEDNEDNYEEEEDDDEDDDELYDEIYWDIDCINRTQNENFKTIQKVNPNRSTIQVPTNIYKQELSINMTAYWSEELDAQFKVNYDNDNELYWQYFCSSNGMFRQYPGAYWNVPRKEDFFDCRLQSWYMMAAASSKDILFLFDISGSMTGLRLEIGKKLIEFILDTFSDNDFFNIILYSDVVSILRCFL